MILNIYAANALKDQRIIKISQMLFNPSNTQGFGFGKPADGNAKPKTDQPNTTNEPAKPSAFVPFGGKTTSNQPSSATSTLIQPNKPSANEPNKTQGAATGFGGKLAPTKVEGAGNQPSVAIIDGKIKIDEPQKKEQKFFQSPLAQLKDELFQYSAIQGGILTDKNIQTILNSFSFLPSDESSRSKALQSLKKPQGLKSLQDIKCLLNETADNKKWGHTFFCLVINQLMHDIEYLSYKGSLDLLNRYLAINQDIFIVGSRFNKELIIKQCNIKILNEISSSVKSQPFFRKIVKEISIIKDTIFLQYHRFFKRLISQDNEEDKLSTCAALKSKKFTTNLAMLIWRNFEFILKAQKKEIKNHFELNIMLGILQDIISINPEAFNEKFVKQNIIPTLSSHFRLIESSSQVKIKLLDEFYLHLMLVHPYNAQKKTRQDISFTRYDYLKFFNNEPITLRPIQHAGGRVFIQKLIEYDNKFSQYEYNFQGYIFSSICNILKDDPQRFWRNVSSYRNIRDYIAHLEDMIQTFAQADEQPEYVSHNDYYYECMCRFAQLVNLLCFPSASVFIQPEKLVKNKYVIRQFVSKSLDIIRMSRQSRQDLQEALSRARLSTQPIYEYFHRRVIKDPNYFTDIKAADNEEDNILDVELFGNYLKQYAQSSTSTQYCILAFTRLIQLRFTRESLSIMKDLSKSDKTYVNYFDQHPKRISYLEYIIKCLMKHARNYIPLARNVLSILKYMPHLHEQPWMQQLLNEFKDLPQRFHTQNISQYAVILEACLKFIQHSPKLMMKIQQFFNFKFANRFLCHILEVSFDHKPMYNKYMKSSQYNQVSIAVRLLKAITELYRKEKESNLGELVPYEVRKLLESQNKDGSYQIMMRNTAISYHLALAALLLSKELKFDYGLHSHYPNMKNEILETLINLNYINLELKHENSLKVTILYNKQLQDEANKGSNIKEQLYDVIVKDPTYLGFEYLISSGSIDSRQKKAMLQRVREIQIDDSYSNMCSRSHFLCLFWNEIQNSKLSIDSAKGWDYVRRQMDNIAKFLNRLIDEKIGVQIITIDEKDSINQILKNIYSFSNLLKDNNKEYYTAFLLKYHRIFLNTTLNEHFILSEQSLNYTTNGYQTNILTFFASRTFIQNDDFERLINESKLHECLWVFLCDLIRITYKKNYHIHNDNQVLQILEFGVTFLIQLEPSNSKNINRWLRQIKQQLVNRPQRNSPLLTKQIIILILLNSKLTQKIQSEQIDFGNKDWLLMMNATTPSRRYASILIAQLFKIYEMHPVFFASACHYLTETAKTIQLEDIYEVTHYKTKRYSVSTLIDVLKKSIQAERNFHTVWIIEVLIEMFMNKAINTNVRNQFCSDIRTNILTLPLMHERIGQLLSKIGPFYSSDFTNLWECDNEKEKKTLKAITFSEKQQLLAYLRLLTFIDFMRKQEKQGLYIDTNASKKCMEIQEKIRQSCLNVIPVLGSLLKDEKKIMQADRLWEKKIKCLQISALLTNSMKSSGIKQLNTEKASQIWKDRSALDLLNEVSNFQLASLCTLWVSRYQQDLQGNKMFTNQDSLESCMENLLKFLEDMKTRIIFLIDSKQAAPILTFISDKIYLGSVQVSKELLFTNMASLSSSLILRYDEIKTKLAQSFMLVYKLVMEIMKTCMKNKIKLDQRLVKMADHLYKSCGKKIGGLLNSPGGLPFDAPPGSDNRSDMSFTKTRTMWSQR